MALVRVEKRITGLLLGVITGSSLFLLLLRDELIQCDFIIFSKQYLTISHVLQPFLLHFQSICSGFQVSDFVVQSGEIGDLRLLGNNAAWVIHIKSWVKVWCMHSRHSETRHVLSLHFGGLDHWGGIHRSLHGFNLLFFLVLSHVEGLRDHLLVQFVDGVLEVLGGVKELDVILLQVTEYYLRRGFEGRGVEFAFSDSDGLMDLTKADQVFLNPISEEL